MARENGSVAIMTVGALVVIIGFCGLALDLSQIYNRRIELQNVADVSALAAARELNGTQAGVTAATQAAAARFLGTAPIALTYQYGRATMTWSDAAIQFGPTPAGPWHSAASALASPDGLLFAKVSTHGLDPAYAEVRASFIPFFAAALHRPMTRASAVAGRSAIKVAPLGICAMRPERKRNRSGELEEYGFRRGIAYDLMQLNPDATDAGQTYLIDPVAPLNASGAPSSNLSTVQAFVCTGTLGIPRVTGGKVSVSSPFPLSSLVSHLNSRFDATAACSTQLAPPDANVKSYDAGTSISWMTTVPAGQAAALSLADGKRWTVTGPDPTPGTTTGPMYGPLWSYAKAVQYAATEPASGYTPYGTSNWNTLYNPGLPKASASYPSTTPYAQASGANFKAPTGGQKGVRNRRVLNVALLSCPVSGSHAAVLGVGRFFMTVPADGTHLYAEFAGLVPEQSLNIEMRLYP